MWRLRAQFLISMFRVFLKAGVSAETLTYWQAAVKAVLLEYVNRYPIYIRINY
jgi:hypothetical protein